MILKSISVFSVGKVMGALYALLGLVIGGLFALISVVGALAGGDGAPVALAMGVGALVIGPIFYGTVGFIGGIIMAALYNLVANFVGGIELELEPSGGHARVAAVPTHGGSPGPS